MLTTCIKVIQKKRLILKGMGPKKLQTCIEHTCLLYTRHHTTLDQTFLPFLANVLLRLRPYWNTKIAQGLLF